MSRRRPLHPGLPGRGSRTRPLGPRNEIVTGPVSDWATDFSHLEPEWAADPYPIQDDLRQRCPIAHTERFGGGVAADALRGRRGDRLRHRALLLAGDHHEQLPAAAGPGAGGRRRRRSRPTRRSTTTRASCCCRRSPRPAVAKQEQATRAFCHSLIDSFEGRDVVDAAHDYAQHIPMRVIADMLGFPPEDGPQFREFVENALEGINLPPEERIARGGEAVRLPARRRSATTSTTRATT